jgi:8-amino-7-oxononanoate synthase
VPLSKLSQEIALLRSNGLLREPKVIDAVAGMVVSVDGRRAVSFCSNDYLGLAGHPDLGRAAVETIERVGVGACSSRLVSGTRREHRQLEEQLAEWLGLERALLMPTGFAANLAVLSALGGREDVIFSDALNHASIVQGCRLSRAALEIYPHRDLNALAQMLSRHPKARRRLIVTDALFSVDGDEAPLADLWQLAVQTDSSLIVDEAHSLGVLGPEGRGLCLGAGFSPDVLVGTFGKAFGVMGAFVAGSKELAQLLESRARSYIYTTAPPPLLASAIGAALGLIRRSHDRRSKLLTSARMLRSALESMGFDTGDGDAHIIPQIVPGVSRSMKMASALLERGVFVQALRPPTVASGRERLRWTPTADHTQAQIQQAISAVGEVVSLFKEVST